jgi:hypothetical protein
MSEKLAPSLHLDAPVPKSKRNGFKPGNQFRFTAGQGGRQAGAQNRATKLSKALSEWLEQQVEDGTMTHAEALAYRMGHIALTAKPGAAIAAAREIADRVEGKPLQAVAVHAGIDAGTAGLIASLAQQLLGPQEIPQLEGEVIEQND